MKRIILAIVAMLTMLGTLQAQHLVAVKNYGKSWPKTMLTLKNKPNGIIYRLREEKQNEHLPRVAEAEGLAPVVFQGATNRLYNGTVLERKGDLVGIQIDHAIGVAVRNITVSNASEVAFSLVNTYETALEWCTARNQGTGVSISGGSSARAMKSGSSAEPVRVSQA